MSVASASKPADPQRGEPDLLLTVRRIPEGSAARCAIPRTGGRVVDIRLVHDDERGWRRLDHGVRTRSGPITLPVGCSATR